MINETRKFIKNKILELKTAYGITEVYYKIANEKKLYPHVVFSFDGISSIAEDNIRKDFRLIVDVWTKDDVAKCEDITDAIIEKLNANNLPQDTILPTVYFENYISVLDEDKFLSHNQIKFIIQNYER